MSDSQQILTYKNNLMQYLQSQNSLTSSNQSQLIPPSPKPETNHSKSALLILGGLLGIIIILVGFWLRKTQKVPKS
jgi:LPXTG-motif cell wall-anchored protein